MGHNLENMTYDRLIELLNKLTLEEKCLMLSGKDGWRTYDVPRLGIPSVRVRLLDSRELIVRFRMVRMVLEVVLSLGFRPDFAGG